MRPPADSRLEALLCLLEEKSQDAARASRELKELKAAILAELEGVYVGPARPSKAYDIGPTSMYPGVTVSYYSQEYLPAAPIRENFPDIYEEFKQQKNYTDIRRVKNR